MNNKNKNKNKNKSKRTNTLMSRKQKQNQNQQPRKVRGPPAPKPKVRPAKPSRVNRSNGSSSKLGGMAHDVGSWIGGKAGDLFQRITGLGTYQVHKNDLMTNTGPPVFDSGRSYSEFVHREFVADITSSVDFESKSYNINPGNSLLFPWLSGPAASFESYEIKGMIAEFKTTSATSIGSTNTALGTLVMSTQYDVNKPAFTDKRSMEAYEYTVSTVPCESAIHPIECDPSQLVLDKLYVTSAGVSASTVNDPRFHNLGVFQVATVGMQSASVIGELWVSYKIRLYMPQLPSVVGDMNVWSVSSYSTSLPWGSQDDITPYPQNSLPIKMEHDQVTGQNCIKIAHAGNYLIAMKWHDGSHSSNHLSIQIAGDPADKWADPTGHFEWASPGFFSETFSPGIESGSETGEYMIQFAFTCGDDTELRPPMTGFSAVGVPSGEHLDIRIFKIPYAYVASETKSLKSGGIIDYKSLTLYEDEEEAVVSLFPLQPLTRSISDLKKRDRDSPDTPRPSIDLDKMGKFEVVDGEYVSLTTAQLEISDLDPPLSKPFLKRTKSRK
jgi:hypothetical protein